jgi:hypothetical protein
MQIEFPGKEGTAMRTLLVVLLTVAVAASASVRTGGSQTPNPWSCNGTYTVEETLVGGLTTSYGLAIKDNVANSIWILNWGDMINYEFDMVSGSSLGQWDITGGVDPDDQAYAEFTSGNQFFMTDYAAPFFAVFEEDGTFIHNIDGPATYTNLFGIGVGNDMVYLGSPNEDVLAWGGPYTGTETSIATWDEMAYESVYGLAVWGDYLFVACGLEGVDNMFIHSLDAAGVPSASPVWSAMFVEAASVNGGIDYDGQYLWVYPQNDFLYKLSIDWTPGALDQGTWGSIKATF